MEPFGKIFDAVGFDENIGREQQLVHKHADAFLDLTLSPVGDDAARKQGMIDMGVDHLTGSFLAPCCCPEHVPPRFPSFVRSGERE